MLPGLCLAPALTLALGGFDAETPGLVWSDFDGDGTLGLFKNPVAGGLEDVIRASGISVQDARTVSWQDVDGDGAKDLFVLHEDVTRSTRLGQAPASTDLRWVDCDQDGHVDLVLFTSAGARLWHNDGLGSLTATAFEWSRVATDAVPALRTVDAVAIDALPARSAVEAQPETARRRALGAGGAGRISAVTGVGAGAATPGAGHDEAMLAGLCSSGITDAATGLCLSAPSDPVLNQLYPLSKELFVDAAGAVEGSAPRRSSSRCVRGVRPNRWVQLRGGGAS